jgi:hypothetical protein
MLTQERLRELLDYDVETGEFRWKVSTTRSVKVGAIAGNLHRAGYRLIRIDRKARLAHRLAWLYVTGEWPPHEIDHIDLDKDNNRWTNLRLATRSENKANCRMPRTNTSGYKGVSWHRRSKKYVVHIGVNGKARHIGLFSTAEAAHAAYVKAAEEMFGEFARAS